MKKSRIIWGILGAVLVVLPGLWLATVWILPVDPREFDFPSPESYRVLDKYGTLLRESVGITGERSRYLPLPAMAPDLVRATLAVEDRNFRSHPGVDLPALLRALTQNLREGETVSGASTITMQTVRLIQGMDRSWVGKLQQISQALRMERVFSKDQILEIYLNLAPYGYGTLGAEAASLRYFGKSAGALSLEEASFLAGIPQAPSLYNPFRRYNSALGRWKTVLQALEVDGYDPGRLKLARENPPQVTGKEEPLTAGHFADYVLSFRPPPGDITTTLDGPLNAQVEKILGMHVDLHRQKGLGNAAAVVVDNRTGGILTMVGSHDWQSQEAGAVNGMLALRQPGSSLKPFAYQLALETGTSPRSVLADVETEYFGADRTLYIPQNYSKTYRGPVVLAEALVMSLNIPAIRLISDTTGLPPYLMRLRSLGFTSLDKEANHYGLGLVLGNGEVRGVELAGAYGTLATGGLKVTPTPFPSPEGAPGVRILEEKSTALITAMLGEERMRIQAFGVNHPLIFDFPVAVKTGTSNQWRDTWCAGYTPEVTLVVWTGNFDGQPMDEVTSLAGAGAAFAKIMHLLKDQGFVRGTNFSPPAGLRWLPVCAYSGQVPGDLCTKTTLVPTYETQGLEPCKSHAAVGSGAGRKIYHLLPPAFDSWMEENHFPRPPSKDEGATDLKILRPRAGDVYILEPGYPRETQTLELAAEIQGRPATVQWILDGRILKTVPWPYRFNWPLELGNHQIQIKSGGKISDPVEFTVK